MTPIKVLEISLRSDTGGGPKYLFDLAESMRDDPLLELSFAAPMDEPFGPRFKNLASRFFPLRHRSFKVCDFLKLFLFVRKNNIQIIHSHGRGAGIYSRLLKLTGAKVVHSFHGIHREPGWIGQIKFWTDRALNPLTDAFIFVSESEHRAALQAGFRFAVTTEVLYPRGPRPDLGKKAYHQPLRLAGISRYDYAKGIDLLLKNLTLFKQKNPEITWIFSLAGDGDRSLFEIPKEISKQVILLGQVSNPIEFLSSQDIYLANSRWEAFNISVLEAISQGLPALISSVPGHEYFIQQNAALGFNATDPNEFNQKLKALIEGRLLPTPLEAFFKNHSLESMHKNYRRYLIELSKNKLPLPRTPE
jgi:glycosyltransferase involved in cell wall biosynthesis